MSICRCSIEITDGQAVIRRSDAGPAAETRAVALTPDDRLVIKESEFTIRDLLDALIAYKEEWLREFFDERGQMAVGTYLYRQLFGETSAGAIWRQCDGVDLCIVTPDEDIARLPWLLLVDRGVFLSTAGWSSALADHLPQSAVELPPSPKILVIAPQPLDWGATEVEAHIEEFQELLAIADQYYLDDSRFKSATTWSDCLTHLETFQADILYYYGHGTGDRHTTRLVFEDAANRAEEKLLPDLQAALQNTPGRSPRLAYINCCQGDAGDQTYPGPLRPVAV